MAAEVPARPVLPSEAERYVTLREFEQRLYNMQMHMVENIKAQRELSDFRATALEKALLLQASEYERRLNVLNHAHEVAVKEAARVVPREMFDQFGSEWNKWRDDVNTKLTNLVPIIERMNGHEVRTRHLESANQTFQGALTIVRFMGFAGVMALIGVVVRMMMGQ